MLEKFNYIIPNVIYFVEKQCPPTWKVDNNSIDFYDLTYVHRGIATYIVDDVPYVLKPGDLIFIPKGSSRKTSTLYEDPMYCSAFNFQMDFMDNKPVDLPFPRVMHIERNDYFLSLLKQFNYLWLEKVDGYIFKSRAVFMLILHCLLSIVSENQAMISPSKRSEKIKAYILNNYQKKIDMNQLADLVKINPVYLGSDFRKSTGCSIKEYITNIRINKAYDLLSSGEYSVSEAAYQCGFDDIFYFSKVFKNAMGFPPSKLIKQ